MNFQSDTPIYQQLKNQIIIGIANGGLTPGESLPSVRQLASDIGVNLHTINKAYNQLKSEGYVIVDRRKGTTIAPIPETADIHSLGFIKEDLQLLIASSICKGFSEKEIMQLAQNTYLTIMTKEDN